MKSILQEASSIAKAIEQGWVKAGKPQEFSIKILEEPQHNFIGITTRSAKVALFFNEKPVKPEFTAKPKTKGYRAEMQQQQQPREQQVEAVEHERTVQSHQEPRETAQRPPVRRPEAQWNDQMIAYARQWLLHVLEVMHKEHITFTIEPQTFYLKITLSEPIFSEREKEKHLLASFALLLLETLKKQFKTGLRGHKIVLTHAR